MMARVRRLAMRAEELAYRVRVKRTKKVERIHGLDLFVPPSVMSPRLFRTGVFLAEVVEAEIDQGDRMLDLGCGSGIVGLTAAKRGAIVLSLDKNPAAVRATRVNAMLNGLRVEAIESDLFERVPDATRFHLIAFNPPFFQRAQ